MIRKMNEKDEQTFYKLTELFYTSEAVLKPIPHEYHVDTFHEMMRSDTYVEGYIFEYDDMPVGYAMTAKTYSHEAGGITLWIEELFILEEYRSKGLGKEFFNFINDTFGNTVARIRLEVEESNERAIKFYKKTGFDVLDYKQMVKETVM